MKTFIIHNSVLDINVKIHNEQGINNFMFSSFGITNVAQ